MLMRHGTTSPSTGWLRRSVGNLSYFGEYGCNSFDAVCACSGNEWDHAQTAAQLDAIADRGS